MKIKPGPLGGQFAGSLSGTVAAPSRYGIVLRTKGAPVNRRTKRQMSVRATFRTLINLWTDTLTEAQRSGWKEWADQTPVEGKHLTGQLAYVRSNTPRLLVARPRIDNAPTIFSNGKPVTRIRTTIGRIGNAIGVNLAGTNLSTDVIVRGRMSADGEVVMFLGPPVNQAVSFFRGPHQIAAHQTDVFFQRVISFAQPFTDLLSNNGDPAAGQRRAIRVSVTYDDGRLSEPYNIIAPVIAETV